jgi:hypothetical protein
MIEPKRPVDASNVNHHTSVGVNLKLHSINAYYLLRGGLGSSLARPGYEFTVFLGYWGHDL